MAVTGVSGRRDSSYGFVFVSADELSKPQKRSREPSPSPPPNTSPPERKKAKGEDGAPARTLPQAQPSTDPPANVNPEDRSAEVLSTEGPD